jgi:hypothetical protein
MKLPGRLSTRFAEWLSPLLYLSDNPISLSGVVLVTSAAVLWIFLLPTLLQGETGNPYLGIPAFLVLPAVFVGGLLLIPLGIAIRRRRAQASAEEAGLPKLSRAAPALRHLLTFVGAATIANIIIVSQWGYSAVTYMDSSSFCGLTCHNVMRPEYTAYVDSSHARVKCVGCHIGPGASWFVRSKLSGAGQVLAVALQNYPKPIPSPVANLRPAQETCEQCHWPQRFTGDRFVVRTSYAADDENNRASSTVLLLKVGGRTWRGSVGIHGVHVDGKARMVYTATDKRRQAIPRVTYVAADGKTTVFDSAEAKANETDLAAGETRTMDCLDCHNRPTHVFQLPERAVDQALAAGQISPALPYIKREAVAALRRPYGARDEALRGIAAYLESFYQRQYPAVYRESKTEIDRARAAIQAIYERNVFPEMNVTWGTYPNNIGHMDFPGCFRCHDGAHKSKDGREIPSDCGTCHDLLAVEETNPKILSDLGYSGK